MINTIGFHYRGMGTTTKETLHKLLDQFPEAASQAPASSDSEVIEALTALGYSAAETRRAVNNLDKLPDLTVEDRIRLALQRMGG